MGTHCHVTWLQFFSYETNRDAAETQISAVNQNLNALSEAVWGSAAQTPLNVFGSLRFGLDGKLPISDKPRASGQVDGPIGSGRWDLAWSQITLVQLGLSSGPANSSTVQVCWHRHRCDQPFDGVGLNFARFKSPYIWVTGTAGSS